MPDWVTVRAAVERLGLVETGVTVADRLLGRIRGTVKTAGGRGGGALTFGAGSHVIGRRNITFQGAFTCGRRCRIEAVTVHLATPYQPTLVFGHGVALSDDVHIACAQQVVLGTDVLIGSRVLITDHNHGQYHGDAPSRPEEPPNRRALSTAPVIIGDNVWIGDLVTILPGTVIGSGCVIGANSVVRGHVGPGQILAGAPARTLRVFDPQRGQWVAAHD